MNAIPAKRAGRGPLAWAFIIVVVTGGLSTSDAAGADRLVREFETDREGAGAEALALARNALNAWCLRHERIQPPADLPPLLGRRSGVFVSAIAGDAPRCCMGSLYPTRQTLAQEIIAAAVAAAGMDVRFPPIRPDELARLRVVVSIVDPPEPIIAPAHLDPAAEGLAVRSASRWGVVLPGETPHRELMVKWARIRAGAGDQERVAHFRLRAFRAIEPPRAD